MSSAKSRIHALALCLLSLPLADAESSLATLRAGDSPVPETQLSGRVLDNDSATPLSGAEVLIANPDGAIVAQTIAAADGSFALDLTASGPHQIAATHPGYRQEFGPLTIQLPLRQQSLSLPLVKACSISGSVIDEQGRPVVSARVALLASATDDQAIATTNTDDRGTFLFGGGLLPGDYGLAVAPPPSGPGASSVRQFPLTYYPGTPESSQMSSIRLEAGESRTVPPISVARATGRRVSGTVSGLRPEELNTFRVYAVTDDGLSLIFKTAEIHSDGSFAIENLPDGSFRILAASRESVVLGGIVASDKRARLGRSAPLPTTGADIEGVDIPLADPAPVTLKLFSPEQSACVANVELSLSSGLGLPLRARTDASGVAKLTNLMPGAYVLTLNPASHCYIVDLPGATRHHRLELNGGEQLKVRVDRRKGKIAGTVLSRAGQPLANITLAIQPATEANLEPPQSTVTDNDGRFSFANLPVAEFHLRSQIDLQLAEESENGSRSSRPLSESLVNSGSDRQLTLKEHAPQ